MQSVGLISVEVKVVFLRLFCCVKIVPLAILFAVTNSILPASASEAPEPKHVQTPNGSGEATAVSRVRVIKPFSMIATAQAATKSHDDGISVLRRTVTRSCSAMLPADPNRGVAEACELRLVELQ
ncbi:hypothetical protein [Parasphingorhabdus sp.]|uniref:hypothetical protein n=1 Tax=Parasphingorhabdus sp. TaxID=2709688 RepID=UPI003A92D5DB